MRLFSNTVDSMAHWMHRVSGLLLILMMTLVVVDVATRTLFSVSSGEFDLTFLGGIELVSFGLLFCILFSLPHSVNKGQVVVDLFTQNISQTVDRLVSSLYTLGFAALGLAMSWRFYHAYQEALSSLETTQDLQIPMSHLYLLACFATAVLGLRSLLVSVQALVPGRTPESNPSHVLLTNGDVS